jgi:hypothetical protein
MIEEITEAIFGNKLDLGLFWWIVAFVGVSAIWEGIKWIGGDKSAFNGDKEEKDEDSP